MKRSFSALLFQWPAQKKPRLALPLFLLLAVLLHLSAIYLFDIVYQAPHVTLPPAAQVFFVLPQTPASQQLATWLQANDPAIFSPLRTVEVNRPKIIDSSIRTPEAQTALKPLPSVPEESPQAPTLPVNEVIVPESSLALTDPAPITPIKNKTTTVHLLDDLKTRTSVPPLSLNHPILPPGITAPLPPTILKVNIDAQGIPRHVLILQSSGNSNADEAATHWFMTSRFNPTIDDSWGTLLILWGSN